MGTPGPLGANDSGTAILSAGGSTAWAASTTAFSVTRTVLTAGSGLGAVVTISVDMTVTANQTCSLSFTAVNGATTVVSAGSFTMGVKSASSSNPIIATQMFPVTGLTLGSTVFQLQYKVSGGSCTINKAALVVQTP